ncbi:MAG: hypothetical protein MUD08_04880 [Cytophagales bacterium]|nr:hypothetical protein [Cytophagales bacterium]
MHSLLQPSPNRFFAEGFIDEEASQMAVHRPLRSDGKTFEQAAASIRNSRVEHLYFFRDDKQIARFRGTSNYVNPPEEALLRMKDCVVLHNHPQGTSFSQADVKAVVRYDAAKLIVVSPKYVYTLVRPKNGWGIKFEDTTTQDVLEEAIASAQDILRKEEAKGMIFSSEKFLKENDYVWQVFFSHFHIPYLYEDRRH